jgi:hypothetical protein
MTVLDLLLGRPPASDEARAECVGPAAGAVHWLDGTTIADSPASL